MYFGKSRGTFAWDVNEQDARDAEAGTQGNLPHRSQIAYSSNNHGTEFVVEGIPYRRGRGEPGSDAHGCLNNCLIDSLRQSLGLQCDCTLVRDDLQRAFPDVDPNDNRRQVTDRSYLDVRCHWRAILTSLFARSTIASSTSCDPNDYRIVVLSTQGSGGTHGTVEGVYTARHTLVILNDSDIHFDPCLRC